MQYVTVRNERGQEMLDLVRSKLEVVPPVSSGKIEWLTMQTVISDDE